MSTPERAEEWAMRSRRSDGLIIVFIGLLALAAVVHALPSPPAAAPVATQESPGTDR
jgi:hypothetical protein